MADWSYFSTSAQLFSAEVSLGGFFSSYKSNCQNRIHWKFRNHKVVSTTTTKSYLNKTPGGASSSPTHTCTRKQKAPTTRL